MYYHPVIGIVIFILAVILSFLLGRLYIKSRLNLFSNNQNKNNTSMPKGDVTAPDAPWLNEK